MERRGLRERVFPKLREYCQHTLGLDVRVIDPFESSDPSRWPDEDTRQQIINECRESSAGPFILALLGHQYGAASLPTQVEVSQYQLLLHEGQKAGISTREVERIYQRDENSIPVSYCLTSPFRRTSGLQLEKEVMLKAKEGEPLKVFQTSASLCVNKGLMTAETASRYYRSVVDADLRFALQRHLKGDITGRCVVYIHNIINTNRQRPKTQINSETISPSEDLSDGPLLFQLCDKFLPALINSSQILVYTTTTTTECDHHHGSTTARRKGYVEALCQQVHQDLVELIKRANIFKSGNNVHVCDALAREGAEQEDVCGILSKFYDVVHPEEEKVRHYVEQNEHQLPLVVTGGPCTGKAVLLAHCARQIKSWLPDSDPVVLPYFCQMASSFPTKELLLSLCQQISSRYHQNTSLKKNLDNQDSHSCTKPREEEATFSFTSDTGLHCELSNTDTTSGCWKNFNSEPFGLTELQKQFSSLLSFLPTAKQPLFLILDGLDHIENHFGYQLIRSLPSPLPPNVKVILSISSSRKKILQALSSQHPQDSLFEVNKESGYVSITLGMANREQCLKMLASLLSSSGRKVTSGQQALVNQALTSCSLALYVRLLHLHISLWHSDSDVKESCLPNGVHSSISTLLDHLEQKHGSAMVSRAVSYLTLSRTGLTEAELADLLSCDDKVLFLYLRQGEKPPSLMKVPQIDVETLLLDLRRFLIGRTVAGVRVLSWASRHFKLVITKRYLFSLELRKEIHSSMAEYFSSRWSEGNAKPLLNSQKFLPSDENAQTTVYMDRQTPSQPIYFPDSSKEHSLMNMRKVLELPHHLQESERWEQMECEVLMSFRFHQAMIQAGLLGDLVAMLESEEGPSHSPLFRQRAFLTGIVKSCACFLQSSPLQLPTVMETNLLPYLEVFPALKSYINDIQQYRRTRERIVRVALCPAPSSVPSIRCLKLNSGNGNICVAEVAVTECGVVAHILDDGTAWFWTGPGYNVAKLSLTSEQQQLQFTGVKSSAQFFLLSTLCTRLFFWNVKGSETFVPLQVPLTSNRQAPTKVEGFVACQKKLFTWRKNQSLVSMFDISDETAMHFQCQKCVTCSVCSSDGSRLCCGQEEGIVSLFDTGTGSVLATWSNSNHKAILWMNLSKEKWELACGDRTGKIAVWEVAAKTHPPRLIKQSFCGDEFDVLNTDSSDDPLMLLLCQSHQVSLWDMCNWELRDQFSAPQDKLFTHAMFSRNGELILALLEACSFIPVWKVETGECVLSLKVTRQPHMLLKTASDVMCVDLDAHLTVWDSASIEAAGTAPKMGHGVKEVVVEPTGEHFYTTDGSETVWRWQFETGLPQAHFLHENPVQKVRLSPDSVHLVTLSVGDLYVWKTETGQNIVRVAGSRATDVLITPKGNVGVSIGEHLSQVWKLTQGSIVCSIHLHLSDAQVSPESTFLIGRHRGDLLAASLWSGSISKRFTSVMSCDLVVAFHTLSKHPDIVLVMVESGAIFTWNIVEETVCRHFQLPYPFHCEPRDFRMTSDGSYALLSMENEAITILDLSRLVIFSLKTEGPVVKLCFDKSESYITYISTLSMQEKTCICSLDPQLLLTVVRLLDGERMASVRLCKRPLSLHVCERHCVFVGFEDGSVGVYCISDAKVSRGMSVAREELSGQLEKRLLDRWLPLSTPNVTWL
ncbi:NACHT and WD repeat domain-containing protein 2-like isoform X3 [Takifugu flavidus]|nr:NACHT and WD repeat domain-containing protein 2-like isoform X3 [Takifugu flavidus]